MDKERVKQLASNPNYIPGIYNYCDRWCERCAYTSKCLNYAISEEQYSDPESQDLKNERFWENVSEMMRISLEMVKELAEKKGINLDEIDKSEFEDKEKRAEKEIEKNQNCTDAKKYIKMVNTWFEDAKEILEEKEKEINYKTDLGLGEESTETEFDQISDGIEVIRWYQHQIYVKIKRAVHGKTMDYLKDVEGADEFPKDSDGSAKVALIGIGRSMAMWSKFLKYFPEMEDSLMEILLNLERLRRNVQEEFPEAKSFKRPGFDYIPKD